MRLLDIDSLRSKTIWFCLWLAALTASFWFPLERLVRESFAVGYSSHIVLIPLISTYLIWSKRSTIFSRVESDKRLGAILVVCALIAGLLAGFVKGGWRSGLAPFLTVSSVLLFVISGFAFIFGTSALRKASFAFSLLALTLPVPAFVLDQVIFTLQSGSASLSTAIFSLLSVPVFRDGFTITVPGVTVEVAKECSGINSTIALFIVALLIAYETLVTPSRRLALILLMFPLSILKNAIRIVTLTLLATKVDPSFLNGQLHHDGGFVFFLITLGIAWPIWNSLRRSESRKAHALGTDARIACP